MPKKFRTKEQASRLVWDRSAHLTPYRADVPEGAVPMITRAVHPCLTLLLNNGMRRWAFKRRAHRDEFVGVFRHLGARNA